MEKSPGKWCALPFTAVTYHADGGVSPCCKHLGRDTTKNFYQMSPREALESPLFKSLQAQFLNGESPATCRKCWADEAAGVQSYRQIAQYEWEWARQTYASPPGLKMMDVGFGNKCNAACIMCDTISSQKWIEDSEVLRLIPGNPFERDNYAVQNFRPQWSAQELGTLQVVLFDQSEAFLQNGFASFVETLAESNTLENVSVLIATNATYWPSEKLLGPLARARQLTLQISVDAVGPLFDYVRHPLKWETFNKTVAKWVEWSGSKPNVSLKARMTLHAINFLAIESVISWWRQHSPTELEFGSVFNPWYLSVMNLPEEVRRRLLQQAPHLRLRQALSLPPDWHPTYKLKSENERLATMRDFIIRYDKARRLELRDVQPDVHRLLFGGEECALRSV